METGVLSPICVGGIANTVYRREEKARNYIYRQCVDMGELIM